MKDLEEEFARVCIFLLCLALAPFSFTFHSPPPLQCEFCLSSKISRFWLQESRYGMKSEEDEQNRQKEEEEKRLFQGVCSTDPCCHLNGLFGCVNSKVLLPLPLNLFFP